MRQPKTPTMRITTQAKTGFNDDFRPTVGAMIAGAAGAADAADADAEPPVIFPFAQWVVTYSCPFCSIVPRMGFSRQPTIGGVEIRNRALLVSCLCPGDNSS